MLVLRYRLAIAGGIAATAIALPVAALASSPSSPPAKPTPPAATAPAAPPVSKSPPQDNPAPPPGAVASKEAAAAQQAASPQEVPAPVQAFAARLGVGTDAAGPAFKEVAQLAGQNGGLNTGSPAFTAIARQLGVSPASLAAAWDAVSGQLAHG
jgi:hypothetical protein